MNTTRLRQARRLFNSNMVPRDVNRANQLKWAQALRRLDDRWLVAKPVPRLPADELRPLLSRGGSALSL